MLGALMLEKDSIITVQEFVTPEAFYTEEHRLIYKAIEELCADLPCQVTASGSMDSMSTYLAGSGVSLKVYGDDMEDLQSSAKALAATLKTVEGTGEVSDGLEEAEVLVRAEATAIYTCATVTPFSMAARLASSTAFSRSDPYLPPL